MKDEIVMANCCNPAVMRNNSMVFIRQGVDPSDARERAFKLCIEQQEVDRLAREKKKEEEP
jgi:hypothetical protein